MAEPYVDDCFEFRAIQKQSKNGLILKLYKGEITHFNYEHRCCVAFFHIISLLYIGDNNCHASVDVNFLRRYNWYRSTIKFSYKEPSYLRRVNLSSNSSANNTYNPQDSFNKINYQQLPH